MRKPTEDQGRALKRMSKAARKARFLSGLEDGSTKRVALRPAS